MMVLNLIMAAALWAGSSDFSAGLGTPNRIFETKAGRVLAWNIGVVRIEPFKTEANLALVELFYVPASPYPNALKPPLLFHYTTTCWISNSQPSDCDPIVGVAFNPSAITNVQVWLVQTVGFGNSIELSK
jgi:hypothetical protein